MKKFIQNKLKEQKGLTLIELLAVIVILAIIAAIAVPAIGNIIDNSRVGAMKSDAVNALNAAELFLADNPEWFETPASGTANTEIDEDDLVGDYLDASDAFDTFSIEEVGDALVFTGTGTIGGVTLDIEDATKSVINSYSNNDRTETTVASGTIQATD